MGYFYGPVYSRRLGFSLGVDILPGKRCTFSCIYCQLGKTEKKSTRRLQYVDLSLLKKELRDILKSSPKIDYITISGSGEPTLHKGLDKIIKAIRAVSGKKYPVCVITNSSLLHRKDVRTELLAADVVVPSLDAPDQKTFNKIDRPCEKVSFRRLVNGLIRFREEYKGRLWLEIMVLAGINDKRDTALKFKQLVSKIKPDQIYINVPVRPSSCSTKKLMPSNRVVKMYKSILSVQHKSPVRKAAEDARTKVTKLKILQSLKRRPQTIDDLAVSFQCLGSIIRRCMRKLLKDRSVIQVVRRGAKYFSVNPVRNRLPQGSR